MNVGLWGARADRRGLASQTTEFARHMRPKVMGFDLTTEDRSPYPCDWSDYEGLDLTVASPLRLGRDEALAWLDGLDVVFGAETFYSDEFVLWAREAGVATVLQVNAEFYRFEREPHLPRPDVIVAPTRWRLDHMPGVEHLPFPVDRQRCAFTPRPLTDGPLTFLHVAGHKALLDRNGTSTVLQALNRVRVPCRLVIRSQSPVSITSGRHGVVDVEVVQADAPTYWEGYDGADVLVLPRRYGGQCLVEGTEIALADGGRVPIESIAVGDKLRDDNGCTVVTDTASRTVAETVTITARGASLTASMDHIHLVADSPTSPLVETRAEHVKAGDWVLIMRPDGAGLSVVEIGPRPKRKGLRVWKDHVELDEGWARIIGLWLAEGCRGRYARPGRNHPIAEVKWTFGPTARAFADEVVAFLHTQGVHATTRWQVSKASSYGVSGTWLVRCRSLWLDTVFDRLGLGHGAWDKRAPDVPASLVPALVGGWLDGDGCVDGGAISGFSRSTQMIQDLWRLCAKAGVMASITHGGQRLDVSEQASAALVASWTRRCVITKEFVRAPRRAATWREHPQGWMAKVSQVETAPGARRVVALETESGRYVANDVLTHNCLPINEAMSCGMPVIATNVDPQRDWLPPVTLIPVRRSRRFNTQAGPIDCYDANPVALAQIMDRLSEDRDLVRVLSDKADGHASAMSWEALRPAYDAVLNEAVRRVR